MKPNLSGYEVKEPPKIIGFTAQQSSIVIVKKKEKS